MLWNILYIKTMKKYCVSCKKNTANKHSSVRKTRQNTLMLVSSCAGCGNKKMKKQVDQNSTKQYLTILIIFETISLK